ncbi:MAG TPA: glycosyltransferase family protein [Chlamydiales bacterium]|nr:glycosyltransferase family protein [Chlamydiales bacterium]
MPQVEIYVQARMSSTRLPGKVLREVMGKPLLEYQLERLKRVAGKPSVVVLTTTNQNDSEIVRVADRCGCSSFRGPEEDVLTRYFQCAMKRNPDAIIRVTADCPLIDPLLIDEVIDTYKEHPYEIDYVSNTLTRNYPRGMDVELFSFTALENTHLLAESDEEREHVTLYMYRHPELFKLQNVGEPHHDKNLRLTVDTEEDFELIELILKTLYPQKPDFALDDVLALLDKHPEWKKINAHIQQKSV